MPSVNIRSNVAQMSVARGREKASTDFPKNVQKLFNALEKWGEKHAQ